MTFKNSGRYKEKCIVCGKDFFKTTTKSKSSALLCKSNIRPSSVLTCSHKCSRIYTHFYRLKNKCKCGNWKQKTSKQCIKCHLRELNKLLDKRGRKK